MYTDEFQSFGDGDSSQSVQSNASLPNGLNEPTTDDPYDYKGVTSPGTPGTLSRMMFSNPPQQPRFGTPSQRASSGSTTAASSAQVPPGLEYLTKVLLQVLEKDEKAEQEQRISSNQLDQDIFQTPTSPTRTSNPSLPPNSSSNSVSPNNPHAISLPSPQFLHHQNRTTSPVFLKHDPTQIRSPHQSTLPSIIGSHDSIGPPIPTQLSPIPSSQHGAKPPIMSGREIDMSHSRGHHGHGHHGHGHHSHEHGRHSHEHHGHPHHSHGDHHSRHHGHNHGHNHNHHGHGHSHHSNHTAHNSHPNHQHPQHRTSADPSHSSQHSDFEQQDHQHHHQHQHHQHQHHHQHDHHHPHQHQHQHLHQHQHQHQQQQLQHSGPRSSHRHTGHFDHMGHTRHFESAPFRESPVHSTPSPSSSSGNLPALPSPLSGAPFNYGQQAHVPESPPSYAHYNASYYAAPPSAPAPHSGPQTYSQPIPPYSQAPSSLPPQQHQPQPFKSQPLSPSQQPNITQQHQHQPLGPQESSDPMLQDQKAFARRSSRKQSSFQQPQQSHQQQQPPQNLPLQQVQSQQEDGEDVDNGDDLCMDSDDDDDAMLKESGEFHQDGSLASASAISRKQFRETIGNDFARDLLSGEYSYDEIIRKYKELYPQHADKFTRNFCSKVRCGRILNTSRTMKQRSVKNGDPRMKRVTKISKRKEWTRMTPELFARILQWEQTHNGAIKQSDIESKFNINRSTYHRWKKKCGNSSVSTTSTGAISGDGNFGGSDVGSVDSDMDGYDDNPQPIFYSDNNNGNNSNNNPSAIDFEQQSTTTTTTVNHT